MRRELPCKREMPFFSFYLQVQTWQNTQAEDAGIRNEPRREVFEDDSDIGRRG